METMDAITRLKAADKKGDAEDVMIELGYLLDEDFQKSWKLVTHGANAFLKNGVLKGKLAATFWSSQLPGRFGRKLAAHPLARRIFWKSCFSQEPLPIGFLENMVGHDPDLIAEAIRTQETFLTNHWPQIRGILPDTYGDFINQCEALAAKVRETDVSLKRHNALLHKVSRETLVVHFSLWLERQFFAAADNLEFETRINGRFEVLEFCLNRKNEHIRRGTQTEHSKSKEEVDKVIDSLMRNEQRLSGLETYGIFDTVEQYLDVLNWVELFCHQGFTIKGCETDQVRCEASNDLNYSAWSWAEKKFQIMHLLYHIPWNEEEQKRVEHAQGVSPNVVSFEGNMEILIGLKFLRDVTGLSSVHLATTKEEVSFYDALQILSCFKWCYRSQFWSKQEEIKAAGLPFTKSLSLCPEMARFASSLPSFFRLPVEVRPPDSFIKIVGTSELAGCVSEENSRAFLHSLAQELMDENVTLDARLFLKSEQCEFLLPRLFSGDLKSFIFNRMFKENHAEISSHHESEIELWFSGQNFHTVRGFKLGAEGEVDVLAYRDGVLFVIEVKSTYLRARVSQVKDLSQQFSKAGIQLQRALENLPSRWEEIRDKAKISDGLPWSQLEVVPLIVSNSFEYDHLYFEGALKVSGFELRMLLDAQAHLLAMLHSVANTFNPVAPDPELMAIQAVRNAGIDIEQEIERFRIFQSRPAPVEEILRAVETSRVWALIFEHDFPLTRLRP